MHRGSRPIADRVADPDAREAPELRDLARVDRGGLSRAAAVEDVDRRHLVLVQPVARVDGPGDHADVRDLLAGRASLDLEDGACGRAVGVADTCGEQLGDPGHQRLHACSRPRRADVDGMHERTPDLGRELFAQPAIRDPVILDVRGQEHLVPIGEHLGQPRPERGSLGSHPDDRRRQSIGDLLQNAIGIGSGAVGLVHEDQRRDAQPLQRAHQQRRLRLHALDGRDHEHDAVQDFQHAVDLRDEVGVAGRIDQVDRDVVDRERHDGGSDRDPTLLFQRERVGLRRPVIDASGLVDDAGGVEQPLGERCLTGVYMRQDSQVERSFQQASYPPNRSKSPSRWT